MGSSRSEEIVYAPAASLEALSKFVACIADEAELALSRLEAGNSPLLSLQRIEAAGKQGVSLTQQLLALTRGQKESDSETVRAIAGERSELLSRKHSGQELSLGERERLALLTVRLEQLLPPISVGDLEALLEMTEEVERIRERAQERRGRMGLS